jgi:hypothetical protein
VTNAEMVAIVMSKRLGRYPYAYEVDAVAAVLAALGLEPEDEFVVPVEVTP